MAATNVLTSAGEAFIISKLNEDIQTKPEYIGWGTGAGTPSKGDTDISTPATEARVLATLTKPSADILQMVATLTCAGAGKTITNAGVFTAAGTGSPPSGGTLVLEGNFDAGIPLQVGDQIIFTFTYEQT